LDLYRLRWKIEEVHLVLKSGCRIEDLRLSSAARVQKALALLTPVAVRVVALRDLSRLSPEALCTRVLTDSEWRALWTQIRGAPPRPRTRPPTIGQATLWIGRLGGHLGRRGDGPPGVRTLWRGLRDLASLAELFETLRQHPP
jgi:Transposase Tn5 dimerisation domain